MDWGMRGCSLLLCDLVVVSKVCAIWLGWSGVVGIVCGCIKGEVWIGGLFDECGGDGGVYVLGGRK